jgi:hypothetical protein
MRTSYYRTTPDTTPGSVCISRFMPRDTHYLWYKQRQDLSQPEPAAQAV